MTTSSAQPVYSITLNDTIDLSDITIENISTISDTITLSNTSMSSINSVVIGTPTVSTVSISDSDVFTFNWNTEEWVDGFPDWVRIQDMCKEYPGLQIAFEKFKTTYKLVKDDYDTPKDKRKKL